MAAAVGEAVALAVRSQLQVVAAMQAASLVVPARSVVRLVVIRTRAAAMPVLATTTVAR